MVRGDRRSLTLSEGRRYARRDPEPGGTVRARLIGACLLALVAAGCTRTLDTKGLEDQIQQILAERGGPKVSQVSCPDGIKVQQGVTFDCTATGDGSTWTIKVTQTDDQGKVNIEIVNAGS
jgi:hypothetical protein